MDVSKATGLEGLSARFLKDGANQISFAIAHILNLSLYSGRIPVDIKTARVVPPNEKNLKSEPGKLQACFYFKIKKTVLKQLENYF